jgi:hypothetical protein
VNTSKAQAAERTDRSGAATHFKIGWWGLLVYLSLGLVLEALHGFKLDFYLNVSNEARRLLWTLAHAHGALISLLHIVFALTLGARPAAPSSIRLASRCLTAALFVLPGGFFLGGIDVHGGDPGIGVLLVPVGGALLFVGVWSTARGLSRG